MQLRMLSLHVTMKHQPVPARGMEQNLGVGVSLGIGVTVNTVTYISCVLVNPTGESRSFELWCDIIYI